jgi:WD40 repeat protein
VLDLDRNKVVSSQATDHAANWYFFSGATTCVVSEGSLGSDGWGVFVYDAISGKELRRWKYTTWWDVCGDSWRAVKGSQFHPNGLICTIRDARCKEPQTGSRDVVFTPRGGEVLTPPNRTVFLWDLEQGKELWRVDRRYPDSSVVFSDDARRLLVISKETLEVWDTSTARVLARCDKDRNMVPTRAEFSPCGRYVLCTGCDVGKAPTSDKGILWDWQENAIKQTYSIPHLDKKFGSTDGTYTGPWLSAMFSSDGNHVVALSQEMVVYEFETMTGRLVNTKELLNNESGEAREVAFPGY